MWGYAAATATLRLSGPLQRLHAAHFPPALMDAATLALKPRLGIPAHVAREEVAAGEAVLGVGRRKGCNRAARARSGIFPGHADIAGASKRFGGSGFGK